MRLTILNNNEEIVNVEGKGNVVLPAILFMRDVTNTVNNAVHAPPPPQTTTTTAATSQVTSRPTSKSGG
jgi:hypothetical protein